MARIIIRQTLPLDRIQSIHDTAIINIVYYTHIKTVGYAVKFMSTFIGNSVFINIDKHYQLFQSYNFENNVEFKVVICNANLPFL